MFKKLFFIGFILFVSITLRAQEDIDAKRDSAFFYYSSKKFLKAGILFEKVALKSNDKNDFYNASCSYSLANSKSKAIQLANLAFNNGLYGFRQDGDFKNLQNEQAFLELLEKEKVEIEFYNKKKQETRVIKPENFDPKTKYPLIIFIHGYGELPETYLDLIKSIDLLKKYIIIIPHGSEVVGRNSFSWSYTNDRAENIIMKSYYQVKEDFLIDENRTYLFGFSQGGGLSYYLGAKYANIFTGIFSISGRPFRVKNYSIKGKKLKKVASIIGTLDKTRNLLYDNVNIESYLKNNEVLFYLKQLEIDHEFPEDKYLLEGFIWLLEEIGN